MNKLFIPALLAALASSAAPAFAGDACSLLKQNEATKFLGTSVAIVHSAAPGDCRYSNASKSENVYITVDTSGDGAQQLAMLGMAHAKQLSGVGSKAYYQAGTLFAQKGHTLVTVAIYKGPQSMETMDPQLTSLARLVLSRL